jgi:radical SAM superfamily enzyme YgiQ (UPF0313 family)
MNTGIKVTLISPYYNVTANGLRLISSYLKQHGHEVNLIFLNVPNSKLGSKLTESVVSDILNLCESSDLIGLSLMTNHFVLAKELTLEIKKRLRAPIIWGGIHPTVQPDECLQYADMVCLGAMPFGNLPHYSVL